MVEHTLGKGEVESSILSRSTILPLPMLPFRRSRLEPCVPPQVHPVQGDGDMARHGKDSNIPSAARLLEDVLRAQAGAFDRAWAR